jgi:Glu-tRNA(Gln) amidotransferase subunit E-like FAD-binding protein
LPKVLTAISLNPKQTAEQASSGFKAVSEEELRKSMAEIMKSRPGIGFSPLMGEMMKLYRGKADGALIAKIVNEGVGNG